MEVVLVETGAETAKATEEMVNTEAKQQQQELEQQYQQQQQLQQQQSKQLSMKLEQLQEYRRHHSEVFQNNNNADDDNSNNDPHELNQSSMYFQPSLKGEDHLDNNHESEQGTESFLGRKTYSCSGITSIEQSLNQQKNNAIITEKEYPRHLLQWREGDGHGEDQEKEQFYQNDNQDILKQLREFLASDSIHATLSELHSKADLMASYSQKQQFLLVNKHFNPKTYFSAHPISTADFTSMLEIEDIKPSGELPVQILKKHCNLQNNSSAGQVKKSSVSFNLSNLQENTITVESTSSSHKNSFNKNNPNNTITNPPTRAMLNSKQSNTRNNNSNHHSAVVFFAPDINPPPIKTAGSTQIVLHPRELFQNEVDTNSSIGYLSSILTLKNPKQSPKLFNVETPFSAANNNIINNNTFNNPLNTASLLGVNSPSLHKLDVSGLSAISVNSPMPAGYDSTPYKKEPFSISELSLLGRSAINNITSNPNSNQKQSNGGCIPSEQICTNSTVKYNEIVSLPSSPRNCSNNTNTTHCVHGMNNQITTSSISNSSSSNNILKGISITLFSADRYSAVYAGTAKEDINTLTQNDYSQGLKNQSAKVEEQIPIIVSSGNGVAGSTIAKLLSPDQFYKPKTNNNNNKSIVTVQIPVNCTLNTTNTNKHSSKENLNKTSTNVMNDKSLLVQKQNQNQRLSMQLQSRGSKSISIHLMNPSQQGCEKDSKMQEILDSKSALSQLKDKQTKCNANSVGLSPGILTKNSINNIQIHKDMETQPSLASLVFRSSFSSQTKSLTNSKNPSPSGRKRPSVNSISKIIFSSKVSPSSSPRFNSSNTTANNFTNITNNNNNHSSLPKGNINNHPAPLNPYLGSFTKGKTYSLYANQRSNSKIKAPYASPKGYSRSIHNNNNNPFNQCSSSSKTFVGGDCGLNPDSFKFHTTNNSRNPSFESKFNPQPQKLFSNSFKGLMDFHENDNYPIENGDDFKQDRQSNQLIGTKRLAKTLQVLSGKDVRDRNNKIASGLRSVNSSISQQKKPMTASSPKKQQQQIISKDNSRVSSPVAASNNNNNTRDRKVQNQKNNNNTIDCSPMAGDRFLRKDRIGRSIPIKNSKNVLFSPQLSQKYIDIYTEMELLNMRMNAADGGSGSGNGGHHSNNVSFSNGLMQQQGEYNHQGGVQQIDSGSFSRRKEAEGGRV